MIKAPEVAELADEPDEKPEALRTASPRLGGGRPPRVEELANPVRLLALIDSFVPGEGEGNGPGGSREVAESVGDYARPERYYELP